MYYALIEPIKMTQSYTLCVTEKTRSGKEIGKYRPVDIEVGKVYETDDQRLISSLKDYTIQQDYSVALENVFKSENIPYKIEMCPVCSGRRKRIVYHPVEVW